MPDKHEPEPVNGYLTQDGTFYKDIKAAQFHNALALIKREAEAENLPWPVLQQFLQTNPSLCINFCITYLELKADQENDGNIHEQDEVETENTNTPFNSTRGRVAAGRVDPEDEDEDLQDP